MYYEGLLQSVGGLEAELSRQTLLWLMGKGISGMWGLSADMQEEEGWDWHVCQEGPEQWGAKGVWQLSRPRVLKCAVTAVTWLCYALAGAGQWAKATGRMASPNK